jgi:hypothetical protein
MSLGALNACRFGGDHALNFLSSGNEGPLELARRSRLGKPEPHTGNCQWNLRVPVTRDSICTERSSEARHAFQRLRAPRPWGPSTCGVACKHAQSRASGSYADQPRKCACRSACSARRAVRRPCGHRRPRRCGSRCLPRVVRRSAECQRPHFGMAAGSRSCGARARRTRGRHVKASRHPGLHSPAAPSRPPATYWRQPRLRQARSNLLRRRRTGRSSSCGPSAPCRPVWRLL